MRYAVFLARQVKVISHNTVIKLDFQLIITVWEFVFVDGRLNTKQKLLPMKRQVAVCFVLCTLPQNSDKEQRQDKK